MVRLAGADDGSNSRLNPAEEPGKRQQPVFLVENAGAVASVGNHRHREQSCGGAGQQADPQASSGVRSDALDLHDRRFRQIHSNPGLGQQSQRVIRQREELPSGEVANPIGDPKPFAAVQCRL